MCNFVDANGMTRQQARDRLLEVYRQLIRLQNATEPDEIAINELNEEIERLNATIQE